MSYESVILSEMNYGGLPFAYWPLEEANGSAAVDLMARARGTDNSGAYVNSPTLNVQPGPINREAAGWITLNGSSQYVDVGTLGNLGSNLGSGISVEAWFATSQTSQGTIFGIYDGTRILKVVLNERPGAPAAGQFDLQLTSSTTLSAVHNLGSALYDGKAHHLVATAMPSTNIVTFYIDGVPKTPSYYNQNSPSSFANWTKAAYLGGYNVNGSLTYPLNGKIGRVALYNYILSADRVNAHYLAGLNGTVNKLRSLTRR